MPKVITELREIARGKSEPKEKPVLPTTTQWQAPDFWKDRDVWAGQAAIAEGYKDGKKQRITTRVMMATQDMLAYNSAGQAIGTYLLGQNKVDRVGIFGPEAALDTKEFFELYTEIFNRYAKTNLTPEEIVLVEIENLE